MLRAREVARSLGGVPRMNTFSKLYLALLGLFPWNYVPTIPAEVILIGKWFHINFHDMSNWTRSMLVPLAIINHFKPTRPAPVTLDELYPDGYHERDLKLARERGVPVFHVVHHGAAGAPSSTSARGRGVRGDGR